MSIPNLIAQTQAALDDALDELMLVESKHREDAAAERRSVEAVIAADGGCKQLLQALAALEGAPVLVGGDLNAALIKARNARRGATR